MNPPDGRVLEPERFQDWIVGDSWNWRWRAVYLSEGRQITLAPAFETKAEARQAAQKAMDRRPEWRLYRAIEASDEAQARIMALALDMADAYESYAEAQAEMSKANLAVVLRDRSQGAA